MLIRGARCLAILIAATISSFAQEINWAGTIGLPAGHTFASTQLVPTADGGVVMVGDEDSAAGGSFVPNIMLVKISSVGNHEWTRHIHGAYGARFAGAYELQGGSIMVAGNEHADTGVANDLWSPMFTALRSNGDSIFKVLYDPPITGGVFFAHCMSVFGLSTFQSLLVCNGDGYTFAYRLDAAGTIGGARVMLHAPHAIQRSFRNGPGRIDLVAQDKKDTITVFHLHDAGDSVGVTLLPLGGLGAFVDHQIISVAPSSTGEYMVGLSVQLDLSPPVWKPAVIRFDAAGRPGPMTILAYGGTNDLMLRTVASMAPGKYFAIPDEVASVIQVSQSNTNDDRTTFPLDWQFCNAIPARDGEYFVSGYEHPSTNEGPHIAKLRIIMPSLAAPWWLPVGKLDLR